MDDPAARQRGVEVLVENTPNALSSAQRLRYFLETTHLNLNVCLDLGHAHMQEGVEAAYKVLASRIRSTHIHDNDRDRDSHLWPGAGTIDWKRTMELLSRAPHKPPFLLEIEDNEKINPVEKMGETFGNLVPA